MKLEERITKGLVVYISIIDYDPIEKRLVIAFLGDPEHTAIVRILTFSGIEEFSDEEFEDEDTDADIIVLDSLIGLDEYPEKDGVRYVVIQTHAR